jgi:hypothetical protein
VYIYIYYSNRFQLCPAPQEKTMLPDRPKERPYRTCGEGCHRGSFDGKHFGYYGKSYEVLGKSTGPGVPK